MNVTVNLSKMGGGPYMGRKSIRVVTKPDVHHKEIPLANVLKNKLMWERVEERSFGSIFQ